MAVEYSLITWAGLGTTVTFTDSGDIVNLTNHGARTGQAFRFIGTGTLPTGLTKNDYPYYLREGSDANKFTIFPTRADAIANTNQITFTGTGSGTNQVLGEYWASRTTEQKARWGTAGSERCYSNISTIVDNYLRVVANRDLTKDIVIEVQGAWTDYSYSQYWLDVLGFSSLTITCYVAGERSDSYHNGIRGGGWVHQTSIRNSPTPSGIPSSHLYGLEFRNITSGLNGISVGDIGTIKRVLCEINSSSTSHAAIQLPKYGTVSHCIAKNSSGIAIREAEFIYCLVMRNIAHGSSVGFAASATSTDVRARNSTYIGNIAYNNTINYGKTTCQAIINSRHSAAYNFGDSTDVKTVTFSNVAGNLTCNLTAHGFPLNYYVRFLDGGGATAPTGITFGTLYFVKALTTDTFTLSATSGGTVIPYTDSGSGTIQLTYVFDTAVSPTAGTVISTDFTDSSNLDFAPSGSTANQVNVIPRDFHARITEPDIKEQVSPNYEPSTYPNELVDAGPYEFDHGNGLAPEVLTISNLTTGTRVIATRADTGASLGTATETSGTATISIAYSGTVNVEARNASSAPYYKPWTTQISFPYTKSVISLQEVD